MYTEGFCAPAGRAVEALWRSEAVFVQDAEWERRDGNPDSMWRLPTCRYDVMRRVCVHVCASAQIFHIAPISLHITLDISLYEPCLHNRFNVPVRRVFCV